MQIKSENLSYTYNPKAKGLAVRAINDISLTVNEGDFLGIIGETGSGKTTFIRHLNGLIKVQKKMGKLTVGEFDLTSKKCNFQRLRAKVGMIFQFPEYQLFAENVQKDVAFGIDNFFPKTSQQDKEDMVRGAIERVGLNYNEVKDKSPFELSGGQKRRVAIAGVIVTKPEVLVLDEPVAGLDPEGKREFMELLHVLKKDYVKTIIIVSHDMNLISENCNRVAVFSHGRIYAEGSPKEVFSRFGELQGLGLELPLTADVSLALSEQGLNVENDYDIEDFTTAVAQVFNKGKGVKA